MFFPPATATLTCPLPPGGDGCFLIDRGGKRYFDGSGGAAVSCLGGHSNARVAQAVKDQVDQLAFAHTGFFTTDPAEQLADLLIKHAPGRLDRVYFVSGGSEAVESAMKLARQFHIENGEPNRRAVIARRQSYHGNTLGALAAGGGNAWRREQFAPLLIDATHVDPCYEYAERREGESLEDYGQRAAQSLEDEILRLGPENVMAFLAEPVVGGATLGAVPPVEGYFKRIREICDQYGVLLILDEVMCGMGGRTGHLFACDAEGGIAPPDILCIAKGLGAGYQPIGAMLCTDRIYDAISAGSGFFQHGHTYIGHPVAAAAGGLAVVSELLERDLVGQARTRGGDSCRRTTGAVCPTRPCRRHPWARHVLGGSGIRGGSRDQGPPLRSLQGGAGGKAQESGLCRGGLICYPMPGTRDGRHGDHVLLAPPPFIASEDELDSALDAFGRALDKVMAAL